MRCGTWDRCRQLMGVAKVGLASNSTGEAPGQRRACAPGVGLTEPVRATHPGGGTLSGSSGLRAPLSCCVTGRGASQAAGRPAAAVASLVCWC